MGRNPMNRVVAAILFTLMTGMVVGACAAAMDCGDTRFAKVCGVIAVIVAPMVAFYWYTIYKTVYVRDRTDMLLEQMNNQNM